MISADRYRLHRRQVVGGTLPEVFAFFKTPLNLEAITPPWLGFKVLHASDAEVREGTRITYRLRLHGLPFKWQSRITEYREDALFADEQVSGPYRMWYHRHLFSAVTGGVAIENYVEYEMPVGPLGRVAHALVVRRQLEGIFDYRTSMIAARFPFQQSEGGKADA